MAALDPMWTKPVKIGDRALDPLGMDRVSDRITNELLVGITTLTQRARYYSFYVWSIYNINKTLNITRFNEFADSFYKRERAFMMACIAHQQSSKDHNLDHSSILGSNKGERVWKERGKNIEMSFKFLANRLGGYGYYYKSSLANLGLTMQEEVRDNVTELGKKLALTFEQSVEKTEYFTEYIEKNVIPKRVLGKYGEKCCLCMLNANAPERELLTNILFSFVEELKDYKNHQNRRNTLSLILYLIEQTSKQQLELDEENFFNAVYFRQIKSNGKLITLNIPHYLDDIVERWRMFVCHDFFSYACEALLSSFLIMLGMYEQTGLSIQQFLEILTNEKATEEISSLLKIPCKKANLKDIKVDEILNHVNMSLTGNINELLLESVSENFDSNCTLKSSLNEYVLAKRIESCFTAKVFNVYNAVMTSIVLLLFLYIRFYHHWKKNNKYWVWLGGNTKSDLSPVRFVIDLNHRMKNKDFSLFDLLDWLIRDYVIEQAGRVALEKAQNILFSRPAFWLHQEGSVYVKDRDYSPRHRNSRFSSCYSILKDLGMIEFTGKYTKLTRIGIEILNKVENGER